MMNRFTLVVAWFPFITAVMVGEEGRPWVRHTIDDSLVGADGVKLADVSGDGLPDITSGWEESGVSRVYLNPGQAGARNPWPAVTVGTAPSVEGAVFTDLDGDGSLDVVSSTEGETRTVFIHWAPPDKKQYMNPRAWTTEGLPGSAQLTQWMFGVPMQIDGQGGVDLLVGSKGPAAGVGWFESPPQPRQLSQWKWHPLARAGWIMSLISSDMDSDGDRDVVLSDRHGALQGAYWLENPGQSSVKNQPWTRHTIGARGRETMFLTLADLDQDGMVDVLAAVKPDQVLYLRRKHENGTMWETFAISLPEGVGTAKAVSVGDIDHDNQLDLVFTCEKATGERSGVMWMSYSGSISRALGEPVISVVLRASSMIA